MSGILKIKRDTTSPATLNDGEFYLNKGINAVQIGSGSSIITLLPLNQIVTGDIILNGDIYANNFGISSSYAETASYAHFAQTTGNVLSASYSATSSVANTALYVLSSNVDGPNGLDSILTASYALTASFAPEYLALSDTNTLLEPYLLSSNTASMLSSYTLNSQTSSFVTNNQTSSFINNNQTSSFLLVNQTSSMLSNYILSSQTSSFINNNQTSSFITNLQTSSFVLNLQTSSMTVNSASFATTASYAQTASLALGVVGFGNLASSSYPFDVTGSTIYSHYSNRVGSTILPITSTVRNFIVGEGAALRGYYSSSVIIGFQAGYQVADETGSTFNVFLGNEAGARSRNVLLSFLGLYRAGYQSETNNSVFIGREAGAFSGVSNDSIFLGRRAGFRQTNVSHSILIGYNVGAAFPVTTDPIGNNNIIIGSNISLPSYTNNSINLGGILFGSGNYAVQTGNPSYDPVSNGKIGINVYPNNYNLEVNGTTNISNGLYVTNSINLTGSNNHTGNYILTGSILSTGSNVFNGITTISGSLITSGSNTFYGSQSISGNLTVTQDLVVLGTGSFGVLSYTYTTVNVVNLTGSNNFGDSLDDIQSFTGSVILTGSLIVTGSSYITASNVAGGQNKYISLWNSNNTLTTGSLFETGSNILIGTTTNPNNDFKLHISGNLSVNEFQISSISASNNLNYVGIFRPSGSNGNTNFLETTESIPRHKWAFRDVNGFNQKREWSINESSIVNINLGWGNATQTLFTGSSLLINPHINVTNGYATMLRGIYYNPTISASVNTNHIAIETTTGSILFKNIPNNNAISNILLYDSDTGQLYYTSSIGLLSGSFTITGVGFPFSGSAVITGSLLVSGSGTVVSGSLNVTSGITGSLLGTASYADSSSYAITASYALNAGAGTGFPFSGSAVITGSLLVSGSGVEVVGNQIISGALTLISGSGSDKLITIRNTTNPTSFIQIAPEAITINSGGYGTSLIFPNNSNSSGDVRLPANASQQTLAISVNGEYANDDGNITLSTIPTASYINSLSQSVNITGSLFVSDVTYQNTTNIVSWNSSTKRFHYMAGGDVVVFPYTGSAIFTASVASLPVIDLKGNMAITGTIGFASQSSTTELRGIYIGNEASASFSSDYNIQFPSGTISTTTHHKSALFEINDLVRPVMRLNTGTTDSYGPQIQFFRNRSTTAVQANQELGELRFHSAYTNSPQTRYGRSAQILVVNSHGNASERSTPARMLFATTPSGSVIPRPRLQIEDNGNVGIGPFSGSAITASATLHVSGSNIIFDIPSKQNGYILQSDANGGATWVAPSTTAVFPYTGSAVISGSLTVTGSIRVSGSITGSLLGTASLATNATNVSVTDNSTTNDTYYITFVGNTTGNQTLRVDSSTLTYNPFTNIITGTSSFAQTTENIQGGSSNYIPKWTGNTTLGSSVIYQNSSTNRIGIGILSPEYLTHIYSNTGQKILKVQGTGSTDPLFLVEGSQGELFSVTDNISGSLFSVNDNSGLPIIDVVSDSTILMGNYSAPMLTTTVKLYTLSTTESLYRIPTGSYDAAFVDIYYSSGSSFGTFRAQAAWSASSISVSTAELRNVTGQYPAIGCVLTGSYAELRVMDANTYYLIKAIIRAI